MTAILILEIAVYLLFNAFVAMMYSHDNDSGHRIGSIIVLMIFGFPIVVVAVVIAICIAIIGMITRGR